MLLLLLLLVVVMLVEVIKIPEPLELSSSPFLDPPPPGPPL